MTSSCCWSAGEKSVIEPRWHGIRSGSWARVMFWWRLPGIQCGEQGRAVGGGTWFITATTITASVCHGWKYINSLLAGEKVTPQNPKYYTFKCSGSPAWEEDEVRQIVQCCKSQESGELNLAHRMLKTWKSREFKGKGSVDGRIIFGDFKIYFPFHFSEGISPKTQL